MTRAVPSDAAMYRRGRGRFGASISAQKAYVVQTSNSSFAIRKGSPVDEYDASPLGSRRRLPARFMPLAVLAVLVATTVVVRWRSSSEEGTAGRQPQREGTAADAVLGVETVRSQPGSDSSQAPKRLALSAGVVIRRGFALTPMHILENAQIELLLDAHGRRVAAGPLITADPVHDLVLLAIDASVPVAPLGRSSNVRAGDPVSVRDSATGSDTTVESVRHEIEGVAGDRFAGVSLMRLARLGSGTSVNVGGSVTDTIGKIVGIVVGGVKADGTPTFTDLVSGPLLAVPLDNVREHFLQRANALDPDGDGWDWPTESSSGSQEAKPPG